MSERSLVFLVDKVKAELQEVIDLLESGEVDSEQELQWCLVGNIVGAHSYGETREVRYGNV